MNILAKYYVKISVFFSSFLISPISLRRVSSGFLSLYISSMALTFLLGCLSAVLDI